MQSRLPELPICPLTVHLQVHYICGSNHQSALTLRQVQRCGCASTSLCGSACRQAADPQIIITIKHCFPNKTISLPLILCQSLFLFTSGYSNPGTALTWGKNEARLKNTPLFWNVCVNDGPSCAFAIRIRSHTWSVHADNVGFFFRCCDFFVSKLAQAVNVMQTLCWAPAEEYPIKKH